ncbi:MAG TPA: FHA domain-containing protein [Solirubrobacteraceae bacterium]|jgi:pSer/pThr/pTyr-binding forkhead associated (FHA) protein
MAPDTIISPAVEGITERFDPISCLDERVRHEAAEGQPSSPGRYLLLEGLERSLVIPIGENAMHIGRGLAADLHLDETSVSRRHAILLPRKQTPRLLDDRSSNGTFVNGERVQQADLCSGDAIMIGRVVLRYVEVR